MDSAEGHEAADKNVVISLSEWKTILQAAATTE